MTDESNLKSTTYTPRNEFVFDSSMDAISSKDLPRTFEAQNITLGIKLTCPDFISKHLENLTGPSVLYKNPRLVSL